MALDAIVTDISTIPEALQSEYVEKDGKFFLQVKPVDGWDLQDIGGLTNSLKAERTLKNQLEKQLAPFKDLDAATARTALAQIAEFEGLTPAEAKALKTEIEGLRKEPKGKTQEQVDGAVTAAKAEWEKALGTHKGEWQTQLDSEKAIANALRGQLKALLVDNDIKTELSKVKLVDGLAPAAEMLISKSVQAVEKDGKLERVVVDAAGEPRFKLEGTSLVPMTVADLVTEMKTTMPGLFAPDAPSGTGMPVSNGGPTPPNVKNPWAKETLNRTEQVLLKKSNPKLAAQLMQAAGVTA